MSKCISVPNCVEIVELRPRYGDFSIFKDGGRRHLGFLKFEIFNVQKFNGQEDRTA